MRRNGLVLAAACAAVAVPGFLGGELLALPISNQGALNMPMMRPLPGVYMMPVIFNTANTTLVGLLNYPNGIGLMRVGRDDTSPYASFETTLSLAGFQPPYPSLSPAPLTFTYRPFWDPALPILNWGPGGPPAWPIVSYMGEHWTAIDLFTQKLEIARAQSRLPTPPAWSITIWVDGGQFGSGTIFESEFYKYDITYN